VGVSNISLGGAFSNTTYAWTLGANNHLTLDTGDTFGTVSVDVTTPVQWTYYAHPTTGAYVAQNADRRVEVTFDPGPASPGGLIRQTEPTPAVEQKFTWTEFTDLSLGGTTTPQYQQIGVLAYHSLSFMLGQVSTAAWSLQAIASQETALQTAGPGHAVGVNGSTYPPTSTTGSYQLNWHDTAPDPAGQVGPGDNFTQTFNQYWRNDPNATTEYMYASGSLDLNGYMENGSPVFLGFNVIDYNNVVMKVIEENPPGTFQTGDSYTLSGSLSVNFSK